MHQASLPVAGLSFALLACGQIAEEPSTTSTSAGPSASASGSSNAANPASPASASGTGSAATSDGTPATSRQPTPAVCSGAVSTPSTYGTASELEIAVRGLWIRCDANSLAVLCPPEDSVVVLGSLDAPQDTTSRAVTCGNLTSHGSGLIPDPSASFTYEVLAQGSGGFSLHVWSASTDRTFDLVYYGGTPSMTYEEAIAISTTSASEAIRRTAFTTY